MGTYISGQNAEDDTLEKRVLAEYSSEGVRKHLEYLATLTRVAGTGDEMKAAVYIKGKLNDYGIEGEIREIDDAFISYPGPAGLEILSPIERSLTCLTYGFAASTPAEGLDGEVVSVGEGTERDYEGVDVRGKIVLVEPRGKKAQVVAAALAEGKGAAAQIHVYTGSSQAIGYNRFGYTWGNPNLERINELPRTPAVSICNDDGKFLRDLLKRGPVLVRLKADVWSGYKKLRFPMGIIRGAKEPEKYVLFATHFCGWFKGVTDNATANAMMLEAARIFAKYRTELGRSVKLAWWPGHSQGRPAGSTWYLENFWDDLRDNAVAYVVTDSIGRIGTSGFSTRNTEEIREFHERVVKDALGLEKKSGRVTKSGDQSFWGLGIPAMAGSTEAKGGDWYSHSMEDTLDKVDMELIKIPFKVIATAIVRLCNSHILPFDFAAVAETFKEGLQDIGKYNKAGLDLNSLMTQVQRLEKNAKAMNDIIENSLLTYKRNRDQGLEDKFKKINACLMELSRILMPVLASKAGKYGQDQRYAKFEPIPKLQALKRLQAMDPHTDAYKALRVSLTIERNIVSDALDSANRALGNVLTAL